MNFRINKKQLSDCVNNILRAVSSKTSFPALEGILIKARDGEIELTSYDLELGMKTTSEAVVMKEGRIVLSAKLFSDIVRKAPDDLICINVDDKYITTIESGESIFNLVGINPDEFPELPSVESDENIKISGEILKGMIRQTIFAVAETDMKPINQGSLFNFYDGIFDLVSVDGFRLAQRREEISSNINTSFVVPGKTLTEVLKLCTDNDIEIIPSRRHIIFKIENYTIISSVLEGEFIDYKNAIPKVSNTTITVKTREFIDSIERVSLLISDRLKSPVRCYFENSSITLSCTTTIGRAKDKLLCEMQGNKLEMGFNSKYLLDALKNTECDEINLQITGNINPLLITPLIGDSFRFLVLPVRIQAEKRD